jgi:hypothetical protein
VVLFNLSGPVFPSLSDDPLVRIISISPSLPFLSSPAFFIPSQIVNPHITGSHFRIISISPSLPFLSSPAFFIPSQIVNLHITSSHFGIYHLTLLRIILVSPGLSVRVSQSPWVSQSPQVQRCKPNTVWSGALVLISKELSVDKSQIQSLFSRSVVEIMATVKGAT